MNSIGKDFPNNKDVIGAYKGLIQLQITYKLDVHEMAKGEISYKGITYKGKTNTSFHTSQHRMMAFIFKIIYQAGKNNSLALNDIFNLAKVAAKMIYMDSSIKFLRGLQKFEKDNPKEFKPIKNMVSQLKKKIVTTNNKIFRNP